MPDFQIEATVSKPHDGLSRLLGDVERFGFRLISAHLETGAGSAWIKMCIGADAVSCDVLRARLSRHPCISELTATKADPHATPTQKGRETDHV